MQSTAKRMVRAKVIDQPSMLVAASALTVAQNGPIPVLRSGTNRLPAKRHNRLTASVAV